jgi:hypothetical protein
MSEITASFEPGSAKLFAEQILGADEGCDFKFLMPQ